MRNDYVILREKVLSSWRYGKIWEDNFELSLRYVNSEDGSQIGNVPNGRLGIAGI
jgi:hypothetical protein